MDPRESITGARVSGRPLAGTTGTTSSLLLLTPLVDMFTILLVFLLMNYSTGGQLLYMVQNILMPESLSREQLEPTVEVSVAKDKLYVDGVVVIEDLAPWHKPGGLLIPPLYETLKIKEQEYKKLEQKAPLFRFSGKVIIQADREIPFQLLKKILFTVDRADFPQISLAVFQKQG